MKTFDTIAFDYAGCKAEVVAFAHLLAANPSLGERNKILPFFKTHRQLAALCGIVSGSLETLAVDRVAWEYDLFGEYACDLVVGDSASHAYCFIEFEDAKPNSIFTKVGKKAARDWSPRFEHGYSQIVDWIQKLMEMAHNPEYVGRFGPGLITFDTALIIGRKESLADGRELGRFRWRRDHVVVHSKRIQCFTFDDLLARMENRLTVMAQGPRTVPKP